MARLSELDEWKQAASVEAGLRREFKAKLDQIAAVCRNNAPASCDKDMALNFIRQIAES